MELYDFEISLVSQFLITKTKNEEYTLYLEIEAGSKNVRFTMQDPYPTENLLELLEANKIWIEKDIKSQKEFGRYKVNYFRESVHNDFWVSSLNVKCL